MPGFYNQLAELDKNKGPIIVSIINGTGIGSKSIWSDGSFIYKQGEETVFKKLEPLLADMKKSQVINVDDFSAFCEFITNENHLIICGAGHISMPIIKIGKMLGFHTTVIDDRSLYANNARQADADNVLCRPFSEALDSIEGSPNHYFVIVTRGHRYDQDCLYKIITKKNAYIGMIGSKIRVKMVMQLLQEQGIEKELLEQVYSPIGLKIAAQTPNEIAISIMAEIIQVKNESKSSYGYPSDILNAIISDELKEMPKSLVTITSRKGSAPRDVGTKMLVMLDGSCLGTIGGGCVESEICSIARQCARDRKPRLQTVNMTPENAENEGMVCGGIIDVYIEPISSE